MPYTLEFSIDQLTPLNSADNTHWRKRNKTKKQFEILVWQQILNRRPVLPLRFARVQIVRHSTNEPDYDNLVSSAKFLLDALVNNGVIRDDKPGVIGRPECHWQKAAPKKGKMTIRVVELQSAPVVMEYAPAEAEAAADG